MSPPARTSRAIAAGTSPRRANAAYVKAFNDYLVTYGVGGVVPTWQLLRTASQWQRCGAAPFEVPPTSEWPNIVADAALHPRLM